MIENHITAAGVEAIKRLYNKEISPEDIALQKTRKEFEGDITMQTFSLAKISGKSPEATAEDLGNYLKENTLHITDYNVIKGFLNLVVDEKYYINFLKDNLDKDGFGLKAPENNAPFLIEYSSPNTNKPLHLGHIRNNLLGWSLAELLKANGKRVIKTNLVNDRGIHICKSMLAWKQWGNGETPQDAGMKGDQLVGKYYVLFDKHYKEEITKLTATGLSAGEAAEKSTLMAEAREMLRKWENGDKETIALWKMMNEWVYEGFDQTYRRLGVDFDNIYHESETYKLGKEIVLQGLKEEHLLQKEDQSIWADLTGEGLDQKLLIRSDGTSVYITQDIGTATLRHDAFNPGAMIYVVGNEQNYHFDILKRILKKLGYGWADKLYHLSYGMVELPHGKMKSREGTVVDADDLMDEMYETAKATTEELGKIEGFTPSELDELYNTLSLGALKYFILKVDPKKNMLFNPQESIDFNGNTGPFIQYTYARISSVLRKAGMSWDDCNIQVPALQTLLSKEKAILKLLHDFPAVVEQAGETYSPAHIANYVYELTKEYNQFYHDYSILKAETPELVSFRLGLSAFTGKVIKSAMGLLGITVPERM